MVLNNTNQKKFHVYNIEIENRSQNNCYEMETLNITLL